MKKDITMGIDEIQRIIREYFENVYSKNLENLEETNKFFDISDLSKLNQEDIRNLNRSMTRKKN